MFADPDVDAALADEALVRAMLSAEAALAAAEAEAGVVPADAAAAIERACAGLPSDLEDLGREAAVDGNPVPALVRRLTAAVPESARPWVHHGATSQDVLDTALVLVVRRAARLVVGHLDAAGDCCARLAAAHRDTLTVGRTLGRQAAPTTFGRKAAGWLVAIDGAADRLADVADHRLAAQLGGPVGTLAALGENADVVTAAYARRLDLGVVELPWHTDRLRVLELASALAAAGVAVAKPATDLLLMVQDEVAEVSFGGGGGSSAMPHKHNPVDAVTVRAGMRRVPGLLATVYAAAEQEHERATGGWHAEWEPLRELARVVGGMTARFAALVAGVDPHVARMRANLDASGGLVMAEAVAARLSPAIGRARAHDLVARCAEQAAARGVPLRDVLVADADVTRHLSDADIDAALDPSAWLGSAAAMVDRAVAAHARRRP